MQGELFGAPASFKKASAPLKGFYKIEEKKT